MKFLVAFALLTTGASAFLPAARFAAPVVQTAKAPFSNSALSFGVDPSLFHDLPQHFDSLQNAFSTVTLSDAAALVPDVVADGADAVVEAAADSGNGWFGFLVGPISGLLVIIHSALESAGLSANAWGISIIVLTLTIKALTFPLTKSQLEGTSKMQAMQPMIKEIQAKYQSNPEVMNQKIAEFYKEKEINPLAGCIPSLVQIPVFIGLYRSVLTLAKDNMLDEGFLWLPSLEGPTYGADPAHGSDWILKGWYVPYYCSLVYVETTLLDPLVLFFLTRFYPFSSLAITTGSMAFLLWDGKLPFPF
jgi:YidC/Oxa1 family membrane protein insertase